MNTKHTPGKLNVSGEGLMIETEATTICQLFASPTKIEKPYYPTIETAKANAERIVRCCNSHDELLENLVRIMDRIKENNLQNLFPSAFERAKAAIKKATE